MAKRIKGVAFCRPTQLFDGTCGGAGGTIRGGGKPRQTTVSSELTFRSPWKRRLLTLDFLTFRTSVLNELWRRPFVHLLTLLAVLAVLELLAVVVSVR
jgi:hypothetical protein